ncbi:hypothetical protein PENNAL_c0320G07854, partial [Penicillium nalgiovense]
KTGTPSSRLSKAKDRRNQTEAKGHVRAFPSAVEKLVRPHDVEALVGRL